jgi:hypothetical protein
VLASLITFTLLYGALGAVGFVLLRRDARSALPEDEPATDDVESPPPFVY